MKPAAFRPIVARAVAEEFYGQLSRRQERAIDIVSSLSLRPASRQAWEAAL